ncbi:MAG TPA: TetR/AcrR family transcriptional regulator [Vicinamibacteria bacterium]|nr:TetR/AcrR family transcriptional regulator [Vicinamibacteria bacterium]
MDAARELFATEGYERVTMRRIAEAIEYSPTTIYHHFEDKDDLVNALCEDDFAQLLAVFKGQVPPDDPVERIRQLGRGYARFGLDNPNHYRFMFMTRAKFEKVPEASPSGQDSFGVLKAAVEEAIASGRFRPGDPQVAAQVLWASLHGVVALLITMQPEHWPHGPASPRLLDEAIENGLRGLLAEPGKA